MERDIIEEFQLKYPTKAEKKQALTEMSNAEINELINAAHNIQAKIFYSSFLKEDEERELRYNHNHGKDGRFTSGPSGSSGGESKKSSGSKSGGSKDSDKKEGGGAGGSDEKPHITDTGFDDSKYFNPADYKDYKGKEGRNYGKADTSDALQEVKEGKHNSLEKYMDADGNLTPERAALHKKIIDDYLEEKQSVDGQAEMIMLGGGPAAGKSSAIKSGQVKMPKENQTVTVDPDDIKKRLAGYNEISKTDDKAAEYFHEESSMIAKQLANTSFDENYNVVYDGTGDGSEKSVMKKVNGARDNGYSVRAVYVTLPTDEAVRRNQARYDHAVAKGESPRLVPEDYVRDCHSKVTDISVACSPAFDKIELYDNNVPQGSSPILIATGGNGQKLSAVSGQEDKYQDFLSKGYVEGNQKRPEGK